MDIRKLSDKYAVCPQFRPDDVPAIAAAGYAAVICNRPDDEDPGQPSAREIAAACEKSGIRFHHIPVTGMPIPETDREAQRRAVASSGGPVLAYCRTGQRSQLIWQG